MTFSIVAWEPTTGKTGIAVATKHLAVGAMVPHTKASVGSIATQAQTNPLLGIHGIQLLEQRILSEGSPDEISIEDIVDLLLRDDPERDARQIHLVDHHGFTAAWTGKECVDWAGHHTFRNFSVAGNMLVGEQVLLAMAEAYQATEDLEFCDRLLCALEAGEAAGGDKRGRQSAALRVMHQDVYPLLDLRVDHHDQPIETLRFLFEESRKDYYQSFRQTMPPQCLRTHAVVTNRLSGEVRKTILAKRNLESSMRAEWQPRSTPVAS